MTETRSKRRWFQFSLRTLFVVTTVLAIVGGWYAHRLKVLNDERNRLVGQWLGQDKIQGAPLSFSDGEFDLGMPSDGVGRIDFHMNNGRGIAKGIYRFDGDKIQVAQSKPGEPRPADFDNEKDYSVWSAKRIAPAKIQP